MTDVMKGLNIHKRYNHHSILTDIQISIKKGEICIIEGKSGSGKSTLLNILGGMEKPTSGQVYYDNCSIYDLNDQGQAKIRGEKFGFIFQSFQLIPELSVRENIALPLQFIDEKISLAAVDDIANKLGIHDQLDKKPAFLSGGQQQRVAIARALITSPQIIFADEPTGNLDETTSKVVVELLVELCQKNDTALVIVTHQKGLITLPHTLYKMKNGRLEQECPHV